MDHTDGVIDGYKHGVRRSDALACYFKSGSVIDLFCGAGGLSHGFKLEGFDVVAGVDIAEAIGTAAADVARGDWDQHFPIDVFQTGSGTFTFWNTVHHIVLVMVLVRRNFSSDL